MGMRKFIPWRFCIRCRAKRLHPTPFGCCAECVAAMRMIRIKAARINKPSHPVRKLLNLIFGNRCASCKKKSKNTFHIDHVIPLVKNGRHALFNFQILCRSCNLSKRNSSRDYRKKWQKKILRSVRMEEDLRGVY